jgi:hypothetical protein
MNLALFPKNEDWGTGDEAQDLRLSLGLKKTAQNLSLESIAEFYFSALTLKTRTYNPAFVITIELVTKALLHYFCPDECNDVLLKKIRGHYFEKESVNFTLPESSDLIQELKVKRRVRYKDQIDFSLTEQSNLERNPFVLDGLKKSPHDLQTKILFKEFRQFLEGQTEVSDKAWSDSLFLGLREGKNILIMRDFAEIWFDRDQLFSFLLIH